MENLKFTLTIECIFNILTKGILVTGRIDEGCIQQGDELELLGDNTSQKVRCKILEKHLKAVSHAKKGEFVGIYLSDVSRSDLARGMRLVIK